MAHFGQARQIRTVRHTKADGRPNRWWTLAVMGLFVILGGPLTGLFGYGLSLVGWSGRPAFLLIPYASLWLITVWRWRHNWRKAAIVTVAALAGLAEMVLFFLWLAAQLADGA